MDLDICGIGRKIMNAKEFATTYADAEVMLSDSYFERYAWVSSSSIKNKYSNKVIGKCVGYYGDSPDDTTIVCIQQNELGIEFLGKSYSTHFFSTTNLLSPARVNLLRIECLQVVSKKHIRVYTYSCNFCKSPARRCAELVVCSNGRCKNNKLIRKKFGSKSKSIKTTDSDGYVICPECKIRDVGFYLKDISSSRFIYKKIMCHGSLEQHKFDHHWENGQKLFFGKINYIYVDGSVLLL